MTTSISELQMMTESEKLYRCAERTLDMHGTTTIDPETLVTLPVPNIRAMLDDKWLLAKISQNYGTIGGSL